MCKTLRQVSSLARAEPCRSVVCIQYFRYSVRSIDVTNWRKSRMGGHHQQTLIIRGACHGTAFNFRICARQPASCRGDEPGASCIRNRLASGPVRHTNFRTIDASQATVGQTYSAEVAEDVHGPKGELLIPRKSEAQLAIRQVSSGGTVVLQNWHWMFSPLPWMAIATR